MNIRDFSYLREWITHRTVPLPTLRLQRVKVDRAALTRVGYFVLVAMLGAGIRMWGLNEIGFNTDEAVYAGQAAAIAQVPILKDIFPVFRAHPLLFQFLLAVLFNFGVSDLAARLLAVGIGVATIYVVYRLGMLMYGPRTGLVAALIIAVMPYHVIVTRQVLLDGPLVLCTTLTLYLLARYALSEHPIWMYAAGIGMGLTFLAKETGIILLGAIYAFFAVSSEIRVRIRDLAISLILMVVTISPFPLSLWLAGGSKIGQQYLVWQLFRRPNHTWEFYLENIPSVIGILVILLAIAGLWLLRRENTWRERLLLWWILVPVVFFQIWPTKGFQYLLPAAPAFAVLASRTLTRWYAPVDFSLLSQMLNSRWFRIVVIGITVLSLFTTSSRAIQVSTSGTFLAGTGGVPGGREAGEWIRDNLPTGATLLTIGPSMANVLEFYGHHKAYGLSVSPNPLYRNPAYKPVHNPDYEIRTNDIQYLVWDSYSAERSSFFSEKLLQLAMRFNGRVVHTQTVRVTTEDGSTIEKPVIVIYKVHP